MKIRLFGFLTIISMLTGLLAVPYGSPVAADDGPAKIDDLLASKIESSLLAELTAGATADFIVRFAEQADLSPAYSMGWDQRGQFVYDTLRALAEKSQAEAKALLDGAGLSYQTFIAGNELYVWDGGFMAANALAALPAVDAIRATRTYFVDPIVEEEPPVNPEALAWGITYTNADDFWTTFGLQGNGIKVANIDTGVQWNHPALDQSFACGGDPTDPACWADPSNICGGSACDNNGHGTHTMGTMVADDDPSLTWQAGMAPNATWIACKGCESNSCSDFALNTCADWIVAPDGDPANRPHVVNNSWGGGGGDAWYQGKVQAWRAAGIFPAFSAGNSGSSCNTLGSPGDYQESFASAAIDVNGNVASFSSRGPSAFGHDPYTKPNIAAPGVAVCSTVPSNSWSCGYSGTSMASPHSAGAVALLWSCNPSLIGQIDPTIEALQDTADATQAGNCGAPPDGEGNYTYGYGYLNVLAAGLQYCATGADGYLDGTVTDDITGSPIEGVAITAERAGGGIWGAETGPDGYYTVTLTAGTYDVTAEFPGYTPGVATGLEIVTDTVTTQSFALVPQGMLTGYVTDADSGAPLDAMVSADNGTIAYTNPDTGYYEMYLDAGTYDVTAEAEDYGSDTATVEILAGGEAQQDFALVAAVAVVPDPIEVTLELGETASASSVMTNNMGVDYPFTFIELSDPGTGLAQDRCGLLGSGGPDPFGYIFKDNVEPDGPMYSFVDISGTGTAVSLGDDDYDGPFPIGFTFNYYGTDQSQFYVGSNGFLSFGAGSTSLSNQCPLPNASTPNNLIALMWDDLDPGDTSDLVYYETFSSCPYGIGACLVVQYENYHHYPGGGTIAGTFEAILFANGNILIQFEDVGGEAGSGSTTGIENGAGTAGLSYACDAAGSLVDETAICFQYPGAPPCFGEDLPWFGTSITGGTVPSGSSLEWTDFFTATSDAGIDQPGTYQARLLVVPDGAGLPTKNVQVVMNVLPTADMGQVEGYVTDTCTGDPIEEALISFDDTFSTTTNAEGYYSYWLAAGTYTVDAAAADYLPGQADVDIIAGETIQQDFALSPTRPCMEVAPQSFEVTLLPDTMFTDTLTIGNIGGEDLTWELREAEGTMRYVGETVIVRAPAVEARPDLPSRSGAVNLPAREFEMHVGWISADVIDVLLVTPDVVGGGDISLLLNTLAAFPDLNVTLWDGNAGTPTVADMEAYDVVFVGNDILWTSSAIDKITLSNNMADYVDAGGRILAGSFIWSYDDWGFGGGRFITEDYSPYEVATVDIWGAAALGAYDADHPIMAGVTAVTDNFNHQNPALTPNGSWIASWSDGQNLVAESPNCVGLNQEYFHSADFGGQTGELLHNALLYLAVPPADWIDVPWVTEVPTAGVTLPDSAYDVDVVFDSAGLDVGMCYTASLGVLHDDPEQTNPFMIPLQLCVVDCVQVTDVDLVQVTAGDIFAGDPVEFSADIIPNTAGKPFSYTIDFGDGTVMEGASSDDPLLFSHAFMMPGIYTVEISVWNCSMEVPVTDTVEVTVEGSIIFLPIALKNS